MTNASRLQIFRLSVLLTLITLSRSEDDSRAGKGLNVLNIVQFPNDACTTSTGKSGVCYTKSECDARSGSAQGSCASGFGVCCYTTAKCGETTSTNNTYFQSSGSDASPCQLTVCKASEDVCQIRMDFDTFETDQPASTTSTVENAQTQCQNSMFYASSDGDFSPVICGTNTGYHMIVEADDECNILTFTFTSASTTKNWDMRISQIPCNVPWKSPEGCTQYFTGSTGTVSSYNFAGGSHLANQNYVNCIRQEEGFCSIAYSSTSSNFQVSGSSGTGERGSSCATDYVMIPRGGTGTSPASNNFDRYCGGALASTGTSSSTVFTRRYPFQIGVYFDGSEVATDLTPGFEISYAQQTSC